MRALLWRVGRRLAASNIGAPLESRRHEHFVLCTDNDPFDSGQTFNDAMPASGPRMKTPFDTPSAITARSVTIVTLRLSLGRLAGSRVDDVMITSSILDEKPLVITRGAERAVRQVQ